MFTDCPDHFTNPLGYWMCVAHEAPGLLVGVLVLLVVLQLLLTSGE